MAGFGGVGKSVDGGLMSKGSFAVIFSAITKHQSLQRNPMNRWVLFEGQKCKVSGWVSSMMN
jgi:hypothetical protein